MDFKSGEIIFKQDQQGDQAFLIETGNVEIYYTHRGGLETSLAILGPGEIFGEMALIDSSLRSASTRATTACKLFVINKEQLRDKLDSSDLTVQLVVKMLLNRLRQQIRNQTGDNLDIINASAHSEIVLDRIKLESQIRDAHQNKEFVMYHQPIIDIKTSKICGSEALIRWNSPEKGLISPGIFIDLLENSALIIPVGFWIIEECFQQSKLVAQKNPGQKFSISINISARQLSNSGFIDTLKMLILKHGINPENFKLEVTERVFIEGGSVIDFLNKCHALGFEISLDDFGTGFSSLQYLSRLPIDFIKIDRSFVMNILGDEKTKAIVSAIIYLSKKLNMQVIAEGIETEAEFKIMKELGANFAQGYLFSKPVELSRLLEML